MHPAFEVFSPQTRQQVFAAFTAGGQLTSRVGVIDPSGRRYGGVCPISAAIFFEVLNRGRPEVSASSPSAPTLAVNAEELGVVARGRDVAAAFAEFVDWIDQLEPKACRCDECRRRARQMPEHTVDRFAEMLGVEPLPTVTEVIVQPVDAPVAAGV